MKELQAAARTNKMLAGTRTHDQQVAVEQAMEPVMEKFSQLETELEEILMQDKVGLYYAYIMCQTLLSNIRQAAEDLGWNESEGAYMPLPERTDPLPEKR